MKKYLGIDWGEKRIGLALADSENRLATPFKVVGNIKELIKIIGEEEISDLIIGSPQKMIDGQVGNPKFKSFVLVLEKELADKKISLNFIDERLSSVQADSLKIGKIKQERDSVSAMIILQAFLDKYYG
ncbi:MAG: Holliday junction resolvase RuvX [Patescibacteria group bacterium]|jgi:putative Holliday junction resolvase